MRSVLGVVLLLIAAFCAWRSGREWKSFWKGRSKPLLADVTTQDLASIPTEWPLNKKRWPRPRPEGEPPMEPPLAAAYGRLAARVQFVSTMAAEVLLVVGGAWLGLTLKELWGDYRRSSDEQTRRRIAEGSPSWRLPSLSLQELAHFLPVILITVGVMALVIAKWYGEAQKCYEEAAKDDVRESVAAATQSAPPRGVRAFLRRLAS